MRALGPPMQDNRHQLLEETPPPHLPQHNPERTRPNSPSIPQIHYSQSSRGWFSYTLSYAFNGYSKIGRSSRIDRGLYSPQSVFTEGRANSKKVFIFTDFGVRLKCSKYSVKKALLVLKKAVTISLVIDTYKILVTNIHKKSHF